MEICIDSVHTFKLYKMMKISESFQYIVVVLFFFLDNKETIVRSGLLRVGTPLSWQKALPHLQLVRSSTTAVKNWRLRSSCGGNIFVLSPAAIHAIN